MNKHAFAIVLEKLGLEYLRIVDCRSIIFGLKMMTSKTLDISQVVAKHHSVYFIHHNGYIVISLNIIVIFLFIN